MARIRTIKPEFFTSDDIVDLSLVARLFYIATWCECDREGRFIWKPREIKRRYFPDDNFDAFEIAQELVTKGLVVLYNDEKLAYIPTFTIHQHLNPRETPSQLPEPPIFESAKPTRQPRVNDASTTREPRDSDAQGGREGKGKERKEIITSKLQTARGGKGRAAASAAAKREPPGGPDGQRSDSDSLTSSLFSGEIADVSDVELDGLIRDGLAIAKLEKERRRIARETGPGPKRGNAGKFASEVLG